MAIMNNGDRLIFRIDAKTIVYTTPQIVNYYSFELPQYFINLFYTDRVIAALGGRQVLDAQPPTGFVFQIRMRQNDWKLLRRAHRQQQAFASAQVPPAIIFDDLYLYEEIDGTQPDRAIAIDQNGNPSEIDTTSPLQGPAVRFFPRYEVFIVPFAEDIQSASNAIGGSRDSTREYGREVNFAAFEIARTTFTPP